MIKHPAVRVRSVVDFAPAVKRRLREIFTEAEAAFPFVVEDFEVTGSYACGKADFHSDFDVNVATGSEENRIAAIRAIRNQPERFQEAMQIIRRLYGEYHLRFDVSFESGSTKDISQKACYRILANQMHNPTSTTRVDRQSDGSLLPRVPRQQIRPPRYHFASVNQDGELVAGLDPFADIVPEWRLAYGAKFLEIGQTPETAHYRKR